MENKLPAEQTDEELVERHEQVKYQLEELDAEAKIIREEFVDRLTKAGLDTKLVGDFNVGKNKMFTYTDTPIEYAREMGAIKEAVDANKLRSLAKSGVKVPGQQEVVYVKITHTKEKENGKD